MRRPPQHRLHRMHQPAAAGTAHRGPAPQEPGASTSAPLARAGDAGNRLVLRDPTVTHRQHHLFPVSGFFLPWCLDIPDVPRALEEAPPLEVVQVPRRREEAIGMVDTETRHGSLAHETEHEPVGRLEDRRLLHADRRQIVDVEEAPVVDLVPGGLPERQAVRLPRQQLVQPVETPGIALHAVVAAHVVFHERLHLGGLADQRRQPALHDLLLPLALLQARGVLLPLWRQMVECRDDAAQLEQLRMLRPECLLQRVETPFQDGHVAAGVEREDRVVVADAESAAPVLELQLLILQEPTILVPEQREQDLVLQLGLDRVPFDIEEARARRRAAILEHVRPPRVAASRDAHVVGHDVHELAHTVAPERLDQTAIVALGAQRRVELPVVSDVVAVRAIGARLQERREVAVGDSERREVRDDPACISERQLGPQLKSVRRDRQTGDGLRIPLEPSEQLLWSHVRLSSFPHSGASSSITIRSRFCGGQRLVRIHRS